MNNLFLRIEPRTRGEDLSPGLSAAVYDPAWLLARQWVMGEFDGEDAGTPVMASATVRTHALAELELGTGQRVPLEASGSPLDMLIEREATLASPRWTMRRRIDIGRELMHRLREAGLLSMIADVVREYPLSVPTGAEAQRDPQAVALARVAAGRLPDGKVCHDDAAVPGSTLTRLQLSATEAAQLKPVLTAWREWLASVQSEPMTGHDAWNAERLEYGARLHVPSWSHALVTDGERGGQVNWSSFDAVPAPAAVQPPAPLTITALPTPVRFRGMPVARYFEMEDANIDLGAVDASATDLARMALLEFGLVYANDMFMFPVRLPIGVVAEIVTLDVDDNFGRTTRISSAARAPSSSTPGWSFLAPATPGGGRLPALVLPHVAGHPLVGPAIEEVRMMRDEMANLAWAIEHMTEGGDGRAKPRAESVPPKAEQPVEAESTLTYRLMTTAPPHWFPLQLDTGLPRRLQLAVLAPSTEQPQGMLLPAPGGFIREEEVPREGVRLVRERVLARSSDGGTHLWIRRRRLVGRGEGSSGLAFDQLEVLT